MNDNEPRFLLVAPDRLAASLVDLWASAMEQMDEPPLLIEAARSIAVKIRAATLAERRMSLNVLDIIPMADLEAALVRRGRIVVPEDWAEEYKDFGPAAEIARAEDGHWFHTGFPWPLVAADASFEPLLEAMGLEGTAVYMQHDAPTLYDHYIDQESPDCRFWEPTKPAGAEWFLLCITDTEDGPAATFVRKAAKGLNPGAAWPFPGQV